MDHEIKIKIWIEEKEFHNCKEDVLAKIEEYFEREWEGNGDDILQQVFERIGEEGRPEDPDVDEDEKYYSPIIYQ